MKQTNIINVKVSNIRPRYNNLEEWINESNNVYIGRKGIIFINNKRYPQHDSMWHNPFKISNNQTRYDVIKKYKKYIVSRIWKENLFSELKKLNNKTLGCWCKPEQCHGDVLVELINKYKIFSTDLEFLEQINNLICEIKNMKLIKIKQNK
jgi:hypothetical protein